MSYRVALIDDRSTEDDVRRDFEGIDVEVIRTPPRSLKEEAWLGELGEPDLVLIDQNLFEQVDYYGAMLSLPLRGYFPDRPLVLISQGDLAQRTGLQQTWTLSEEHELVDDEVFRGPRLRKRAPELASLMDGYRLLRSRAAEDGDGRRVRALPEFLGIDSLEGLENTGLEIKQLAAGSNTEEPSWEPYEIAQWIRQNLFRFPGPLLDDIHAAAELGVDPGLIRGEVTEDYLAAANRLQEIITPAKYAGVFASPGNSRWWRQRLRTIAHRLIQEHDGNGSGASSIRFPRALSVVVNREIPPVVDDWSGRPGVDTVCYLSSRPIKLETSFAYNPDSRPPGMQRARLSFRSLRNRHDYDVQLLEPLGQSQIQDVLAMPDPWPAPAAPAAPDQAPS
jgi:hypothetical protein